MNKTNKVKENELMFRRIKERERMQFYEYAFESTKGFAVSLGISFDVLEKFCRINRLLLGLPGRLLMKNTVDIVAELDGEIASGYTLLFDKAKNTYTLANVFTRPKFQRRGIASIMMRRVISQSEGKKIDLEVNAKNEIAIYLYKKFGFVERSSSKRFIHETPLVTKPFPSNYHARLAVKEDLGKLQRLQQELPDKQNLSKSYKKSFNKAEKKSLRIGYQLPAVLLKNDEIVGIGRARWSKATPNTAQIIATAILPEAKEAYPCFVSFLTEAVQKYDITKFIWDTNERTKSFEDQLLPYLGEPARVELTMVRESQSQINAKKTNDY